MFRIGELFFRTVVPVMVFIVLIFTGLLVALTYQKGSQFFNIRFLTGYPSRFPHESGILPPLVGSVIIFILTFIVSSVIGISTAVYVEEILRNKRIKDIFNSSIDAINGVPSILFGLFMADLLGKWMGLGNSLVTASASLSFLSLPPIIVSTRNALNSFPKDVKDGMFSLGATRYQVIFRLVLPAVYGAILTGCILAMARAVGEAAPLIAIGAVAFMPYIPLSPLDDTSALPIQIFTWVSRPQEGFHNAAAATIIVLLVIVFGLNSLAMYVRYLWRVKKVW